MTKYKKIQAIIAIILQIYYEIYRNSFNFMINFVCQKYLVNILAIYPFSFVSRSILINVIFIDKIFIEIAIISRLIATITDANH